MGCPMFNLPSEGPMNAAHWGRKENTLKGTHPMNKLIKVLEGLSITKRTQFLALQKEFSS
jgi:hypothetical protein